MCDSDKNIQLRVCLCMHHDEFIMVCSSARRGSDNCRFRISCFLWILSILAWALWPPTVEIIQYGVQSVRTREEDMCGCLCTCDGGKGKELGLIWEGSSMGGGCDVVHVGNSF